VNEVLAGPILAVEIEAGAGGFITVILLCLACAGLFYFMSGSLRRLRGNVARGEFGADTRRGDEPPADDAQPTGAPLVPHQTDASDADQRP
jgi:hypothetical protein